MFLAALAATEVPPAVPVLWLKDEWEPSEAEQRWMAEVVEDLSLIAQRIREAFKLPVDLLSPLPSHLPSPRRP